MNKKNLLLLIIPFLLFSCKQPEKVDDTLEITYDDYGAFLGRDSNDVRNFNNYKYVSCEIKEFTQTNISRLSAHGVNFLAYLNVGSLENYRDYYEDYESYTFKDYENWPDERWIDVTNNNWQSLMIEVATNFKIMGAFGIYLDNVDVYSVAKEDGLNYLDFGNALKNIISQINSLGLKVMINGGAEFLDDMNDLGDSIFDSIWAYHQEEVFSLIADYERNIFTTQTAEDKQYYQEVASMMKQKGKEVFLLEYTADYSLKDEVKAYCLQMAYHYYISNNIELI